MGKRNWPGRSRPKAHARQPPVAFETADREIRILFFGPKNRTYKIFYSIDTTIRVVSVFHVRHWARKMPTPAEMDELISQPDKSPNSD
jgi:enterochelin esterase-like enzyme